MITKLIDANRPGIIIVGILKELAKISSIRMIAYAMRDASAEAVRLRSRVRELEARLRHAMSGACAERVRLRARVRELEARLRRYKPTHCIAPVRPNNGVPARGRC